MIPRRSFLFATVLSAVLSSAAVAGAQAPPSGPAAAAPAAAPTEAELDALFAGAKAAFNAGRNKEAYAAYTKLWAAPRRTYDIAANLAQVELQLGLRHQAAEHLSFAVQSFPMTGERERKALLEKELAAVRKEVGALRIEVNVDGATVSVDGNAVGKSPLGGEVFVAPGTRKVEAKFVDYAGEPQVVKVAPGGTGEVKLTLVAPKAEVVVAPPRLEPTALGLRPPVPAKVQERSWVPGIVLGAASVVALGVGVGTTVASNSASDEKNAQKKAIFSAGGGCIDAPSAYVERCSELRSTASRVDTFANAARVAYAASGVLALAAVTYVLWPRPKDPAPRLARVLPELHPTGAGVVLRGMW